MKSRRVCSLFIVLLLAIFMLVSCSRSVATSSLKESAETSAPKESSAMPSTSTQTGEFLFYLEDLSGKAGQTVTVNLKIANNPAIAGFSVTVGYDSENLEFVSAENQIEGGYAVVNSKTAGKARLMCTKAGGNTLDSNGLCYTVTFRIKESVPQGSLDLTLSLADEKDTVYTFENGTSTRIPCDFFGCTLTVTG